MCGKLKLKGTLQDPQYQKFYAIGLKEHLEEKLEAEGAGMEDGASELAPEFAAMSAVRWVVATAREAPPAPPSGRTGRRASRREGTQGGPDRGRMGCRRVGKAGVCGVCGVWCVVCVCV